MKNGKQVGIQLCLTQGVKRATIMGLLKFELYDIIVYEHFYFEWKRSISPLFTLIIYFFLNVYLPVTTNEYPFFIAISLTKGGATWGQGWTIAPPNLIFLFYCPPII